MKEPYDWVSIGNGAVLHIPRRGEQLIRSEQLRRFGPALCGAYVHAVVMGTRQWPLCKRCLGTIKQLS